MKKIIFKYSAFLLAGFLFNFWLEFLAPFDLPEYIPNTPIRIAGVLILLVIMPVMIFSLKAILKNDETLTISKLAFSGMLICLIAEIVFQSLRQFTLLHYSFSERIYYFLLGITGVTIFGTILSFFIAYQLKTRKTGTLVLMIIGFYAIFYIVKYFVPALNGE